MANRESPTPLFGWRVLSPDGSRARSSSGRAIDVDGGLNDDPADAVLLLASYHPDQMMTNRLRHWLRRHAARGTLMGCVDTGALLFAESGLLSRHPAAAHREAIVGFREAHGDTIFTDRLFDLEGTLCSSAGGVATLDMTLAVIERFASRRLALRVAEILNYCPLAGSRANGDLRLDWSIPRLNRTLAQCVEIMLANVECPLPIQTICDRVGWPQWRVRRLFHRYVAMSPRAYYLELRLDRARNLLRNSHEKVGTIALMCGFPAVESMSRAYRARYGVSPSKDRAL